MSLGVFSDHRGDLIPIEFDDLPFVPKRIFLVKNVPKLQIRGDHAHYNTKQIIYCLQGSVEVKIDDGVCVKVKKLKAGENLYIPNKTWDKQRYLKDNTILLVICSTLYDKNDYIDDYNVFLNLFKKNS